MKDDFMEYMLLYDDEEEDEPKPGDKSGCGCLPTLLIVGQIIILLIVFGH